MARRARLSEIALSTTSCVPERAPGTALRPMNTMTSSPPLASVMVASSSGASKAACTLMARTRPAMVACWRYWSSAMGVAPDNHGEHTSRPGRLLRYVRSQVAKLGQGLARSRQVVERHDGRIHMGDLA